MVYRDNKFVDYSNHPVLHGNKCVYIWRDENGKVFYVGSGTETRAGQRSSRHNEAFLKKLNDKCKCYLLARGIHRLAAFQMEFEVVYYYKLRNAPLINVAYAKDRFKYATCYDAPIFLNSEWEDASKPIHYTIEQFNQRLDYLKPEPINN